MQSKVLELLSLVASVSAIATPNYGGFNLQWSDTFDGAAGSSPNTGRWNLITGNNNANGELEYYTTSNKNLQLSGGSTLQIVPWRDSTVNGGWTSGRIESTYTWTPQAGKVTRIEAYISLGSNDPSTKQGIWPAWWSLGDSIRHGTGWPECGEIDVFEQVDGALTGYGTLHCDVYPGGICNESTGLSASIGIPNQSWHTWRVDIDRTNGNWLDQTIQWSMDGNVYHTITGAQINDNGVWNTVTATPFYFLLNVAVGGGCSTQDGYGAMMEVGYVAHYST